MSPSDTPVEARWHIPDYNELKRIGLVLLPNWVSVFDVVPSSDTEEIMVSATRRFAEERWVLLELAGNRGVLATVILLTSGRQLRKDEDVTVTVTIPEAHVGRIDVRVFNY
ncbi:MAG TPA: hypothetical protein VJ841_05570 [Candidatus Saccharimonadales bacterium]|nr:hypothetical protein [Candidatus Saccharimonadales bacterium]